MSTFRVGQRVRLIETDLPGYNKGTHIGQCGTIAGEMFISPVMGDKRYPVTLDSGERVNPIPMAIEPLDDYNGNQVTTWSTTIWKPSQVRA